MAIFVNLPILADPDKPIFNQTLKLEMTVKQSGESFLPTYFFYNGFGQHIRYIDRHYCIYFMLNNKKKTVG